MIVATLLGLRPYTPPNGKPISVVDLSFKSEHKKLNPMADGNKIEAYARYKAAFDQLGGKATANQLIPLVKARDPRPWLRSNENINVRVCGKVERKESKRHESIWQWIGD